MKTREYVDGITLREYIVKSLVYKSYRELIRDITFIEKTNISVLGTLTHHAKRKHKISLEEVYEYATDNLMILPGTTFEEWMKDTGRDSTLKSMKKADKKRKKSKKELMCSIGTRIGLILDKTEDEDILMECLKDFLDLDEILSELKRLGYED